MKIHSKNSFEEYIKIEILYERNINVDINIEFVNSNACDAYVIQAADYIANSIYVKYEKGKDKCYNKKTSKIKKEIYYPQENFGK